MNEVIIPWDFFWLLAMMFVVLVVVIGCSLVLKTRHRTRLTDPRKDHAYKRYE